MTVAQVRTLAGGCHCGAVRFEVDVPRDSAPGGVEVWRCNCSICSKTGYLHLMVAFEQFRLLEGELALTSYRFVNVRCLDGEVLANAVVRDFDGQNWEQSAHEFDSADER